MNVAHQSTSQQTHALQIADAQCACPYLTMMILAMVELPRTVASTMHAFSCSPAVTPVTCVGMLPAVLDGSTARASAATAAPSTTVPARLRGEAAVPALSSVEA